MALGRRRVPCISRQRAPVSTGWPRTCGTSIMSDRMFVLGAIHILSGFTVLSLGIMSLLHRTFAHEYCVAIIGGCLLVATGVLGVLTAHLRTTCTLLSFFVCTIFCVALAGIIFALSVVGIGYDFARHGAATTAVGGGSGMASASRQTAVNANSNFLHEPAYVATNSVNAAAVVPGQAADNGVLRSDTAIIPRSGELPTNSMVTSRGINTAEESWRKNALSIHCTQLAASVLALAVALVAAISCTKRVCCNPNVSFFENRVRVSLVLPQLLPAPPLASDDIETTHARSITANSLLSRADTETQTEPALSNSAGESSLNQSHSQTLIAPAVTSDMDAHRELQFVEITNHGDPPNNISIDQASRLNPTADGASTSQRIELRNSNTPSTSTVHGHNQINTVVRRPTDSASSRSRRIRATPYNRNHSHAEGDMTRVSLTLSSANRQVRAYYRCGMPIGPFFLNAADLPAICPPERLVGEAPAAVHSRSRSNRPRSSPLSTPTTIGSEPSSVSTVAQVQAPSTSLEQNVEQHSRRSLLPNFLRRRTRSRRRDVSLPDNRIVYLYTTSRSNELEGYVYPAPPPPYFVDQVDSVASRQVASHTASSNESLPIFMRRPGRSEETQSNPSNTGNTVDVEAGAGAESDAEATPAVANFNASPADDDDGVLLRRRPAENDRDHYRDSETLTENRPLLRHSNESEQPPAYTTLDRGSGSRFRWLRSSARNDDGDGDSNQDAAERSALC